ncbi:MAG TPA: hypothetical protein VE053_08985 [Allosphingosinicella sp.]|nr:hypothetical protein [Allosphingosinicella sp.]
MNNKPMNSSLLACLLSVSLAGCSTFHVYQTGGVEDRQPQNMPDTEWVYVKRNSYLWGLVRQDLPVDNCRDGAGNRKGIEEIRVDRTAAQGLASILTLGLWTPLKIGWRCNKLPGVTDTLGETDDASEVRP